MNTKTKFGMLIASVALAASGAVCAADAPANPYVQAAGQTLMTNFGLCVRTGYWTPALAEAQGALGQNCQTLLSAKPAQKELLFLPTHSSPSTKPF